MDVHLDVLVLFMTQIGGSHMNRLSLALISAVSALAFTQIASAADLPVKAPAFMPPPPPVLSWSGWYVGVNAGYNWSTGSVDTTTTPVSTIGGLNGNIGAAVAAQGTGSVSPKDDGFIGGGQIGYNWNLGGFVAGIEADIQGLSNQNTEETITNVGTVPGAATTIASTGTITSSKKVDWLGTLRGRVGVLASTPLLIYATGGLAYGKVSSSTNITETLGFIDTPAPFGTSGSFSDTRAGWTVGAGFEWMFAPQWSVKAEYLYYDLGTETYSLGNINQFGLNGALLETVSASQSSVRFNGNIARAGVNFHF